MINLPGNADLNQVANLKEQLITTLQSGSKEPIVFDASNVENITTPLIQLLLIALLEGQKNGTAVSIQDPSQNFMTIIKDFGCLDHFEGAII
jgi:anti-anti-sigma regulatory factor